MKFVRLDGAYLGDLVYEFHCPGCEYDHFIRVIGEGSNWKVTGVEDDAPTVTPSILVHGKYRCHSFIKNGKIQYLNDCTHHLVGKTIDIPDFDEI